MPFKWLQHDSNPPGLYYCGVTILGSAPPPTDTMMSVFLLPTLNGGKKKIVSTISDLRESCSLLTCRRCPYCSEKAWVILFGEKTRVGIRDVSGLMSGTVGTGPLYGDCAWKPWQEGLPLASRMPPVHSECWLAKVTLPLSWEPLWMPPNSTR